MAVERGHDVARANGLQDDAGIALGEVIAMALHLFVKEAALGDRRGDHARQRHADQ